MLKFQQIQDISTRNTRGRAYLHLTKEDILAAVSYSADVIAKEELIAP
ncbi:MAG: hypothetical protein HUU08_12750 [Candidatus Brocadia sp.]|nr:hypothetical protein [Candidatus Brocadia sp.]